MKKCLTVALGALTLGSTAALAGADTFYLGKGTGAEDDYTAPQGSDVINSYARLTSIDKVRSEIEVDSCTGVPCFAKDDLIMVLQMTGTKTSEAGHWELARVKAVDGKRLTLTEPLLRNYAANATQVIWVREFNNVTIGKDSTVAAKPWDGTVGGVVAFLAAELVKNEGTITASELGFRGGDLLNSSNASVACSSNTGAPKGEGVISARYGVAYLGGGSSDDNGAGGGVCSSFGGGGGGNGGKGGVGGGASGGNGGAAPDLKRGLIDRLLLGGGGGAGHGNKRSSGSYGNGGGIVFIRGNMLTGDGFISAAGAAGKSNDDTTSGGGSGGGAGGSIYLRFAGAAACTNENFNVTGGIGGGTNAQKTGSGGGGGGGRMLFQAAADSTCQPDLNKAAITAHGTKGGIKLGGFAGADGDDGSFERLMPVTPPTVSSLGKNGFTNNPKPDIQGDSKEAGATVIIFVDGKEVGRAPRTSNGNYVLPPSAASLPLADGDHKVEAINEVDGMRSPKSEPMTFVVDTTPPGAKIDLKPESLSNLKDAPFTFSHGGTERGPVTYLCKLETEKEFSNCTGPKTYTGLPDGEHTFEVKATDQVGNADPSPARYTWTVDTTPPNVRIVSGPESTTLKTSATLEFAVEEPEKSGVTYKCLLDGKDYEPCTPGLTVDAPLGTHTFEVRASDAAGNESSPAIHEWTVEDMAFRGNGFGCSATGGDSALVLMGLGSFLALARRRRQN